MKKGGSWPPFWRLSIATRFCPFGHYSAFRADMLSYLLKKGIKHIEGCSVEWFCVVRERQRSTRSSRPDSLALRNKLTLSRPSGVEFSSWKPTLAGTSIRDPKTTDICRDVDGSFAPNVGRRSRSRRCPEADISCDRAVRGVATSLRAHLSNAVKGCGLLNVYTFAHPLAFVALDFVQAILSQPSVGCHRPCHRDYVCHPPR